ncbi:MAG: acyltransferase family protein [Vicinamibacterales bacterium]
MPLLTPVSQPGTALPVDRAAAPGGTSAATDGLPALTGIRFPLALWVVVHHLSGPGRMLDAVTRATPAVATFVESAWLALTAFFAISGFVIALRYRTTPWTGARLARFTVARISRIYPVYALSLLILLPIMVEHVGAGDRGTAPAVVLLLDYAFLLQGWHAPLVNWNTPAWSLSSEVFFYACAPLILLLLRTPTLRRVLALIAVACALPVVMRLIFTPPVPKALLYLGDFLVGMAAAGLYESLRRRGAHLARVGPWLYGPAIVGGVALVLGRDAIGSFVVFDTGIRLTSVLLVLGLACGGGWVAHGLSTPLALATGRASYALYILHVPASWWFKRSPAYAALPPVAAGMVFMLGAVALSLLVSRWYEPQAGDAVKRAWERWRTGEAGVRIGDGPVRESRHRAPARVSVASPPARW